MIIKSIAFFGHSRAKQNSPSFQAAKRVARAVAESGRRVVNGGGPGIMLAATLGAKEVKGKTTAVYYKPELTTNLEKSALNFADKRYEEVNYITRTRRLLELGNAYIIFNGSTGTISEFAMAWGCARLYFGHHKPLILYGNFWHHIIAAFKKNMRVRKEEFEVYTIVNSVYEAMRAIETYEVIVENNRHKHKKCIGDECQFLLL